MAEPFHSWMNTDYIFGLIIWLDFLTNAKIRQFWGILSALVKDSRQFKKREKQLVTVTVNLPLYKQLQH
jgi:hypothetical protein